MNRMKIKTEPPKPRSVPSNYSPIANVCCRLESRVGMLLVNEAIRIAGSTSELVRQTRIDHSTLSRWSKGVKKTSPKGLAKIINWIEEVEEHGIKKRPPGFWRT